MPELPEVETIVRGLRKKIIGRKIKSVWLGAPALIKKQTANSFRKEIKGLKIIAINRRAKNIIINLSQKKILLIHQKMTGHLLYGQWLIEKNHARPLIKGALEEKNNLYLRVIFNLDNGWQLGLADLRKFAKIILTSEEKIKTLPDLKDLGPEPLEKNFDLKKLKLILKNKGGKIKAVLMDPKIIAGIGNIYGDEILWRARVQPFRSPDSLTEKELKNIFGAIKEVLKDAVKKRGSSVGDYRDSAGEMGHYQEEHQAYGREGEKCSRCRTKIIRRKISSRSAHFCPRCQK